MADGDKRMAGNYEITHSLHIGDREVVFGVDLASDKPYFCALYHEIFQIIQTRELYEDCFSSDNYIEVTERFSAYLQKQCQKVREEWAKVTVPRDKITPEMCYPIEAGQDLRGMVIAIKPEYLYPEYQTADRQLILVESGGGAEGNRISTTCYGYKLYSGKRLCWGRHELMGEVKPECLPEWAKTRAAEIRLKLEQERKTAWER